MFCEHVSYRCSYTIASEHTFVNGAQKNPNKGLHFFRTYVTIISANDARIIQQTGGKDYGTG